MLRIAFYLAVAFAIAWLLTGGPWAAGGYIDSPPPAGTEATPR